MIYAQAHMIISISGQDTYRSRQYLKQTIEHFKKTRDPQGYNVVVLDGKNEDVGKIIGEIRTTPFLSPRRMIVIQNILSNNDKGLLKKEKYAQDFELMKGVKLNDWILSEVEKNGGKISRAALTFLAQNAGH